MKQLKCTLTKPRSTLKSPRGGRRERAPAAVVCNVMRLYMIYYRTNNKDYSKPSKFVAKACDIIETNITSDVL